MKDNLIVNYSKEKTYNYILIDAYTFKSNIIAKLIKKILLILKIIKQDVNQTVEFHKKVINTTTVLAKINAVIRELRINQEDIYCILIGRKQVGMLDDEFFTAAYIEEFKDGYNYRGINIQINPYIDGIVPVLGRR